jgi:hypothetical protein
MILLCLCLLLLIKVATCCSPVGQGSTVVCCIMSVCVVHEWLLSNIWHCFSLICDQLHLICIVVACAHVGLANVGVLELSLLLHNLLWVVMHSIMFI